MGDLPTKLEFIVLEFDAVSLKLLELLAYELELFFVDVLALSELLF
jgi:hypothetical protein